MLGLCLAATTCQSLDMFFGFAACSVQSQIHLRYFCPFCLVEISVRIRSFCMPADINANVLCMVKGCVMMRVNVCIHTCMCVYTVCVCLRVSVFSCFSSRMHINIQYIHRHMQTIPYNHICRSKNNQNNSPWSHELGLQNPEVQPRLLHLPHLRSPSTHRSSSLDVTEALISVEN